MKRLLVGGALAVLSVTGCGDDSGGALDAAMDAPLDTMGDAAGDGGTGALEWTPCGDGRAECASLVVPIDHEAPDGDTLTLPLVRLPALSPSQRIGVLFYAPGGPGSSGVTDVSELPTRLFPGMGEVFRRFDVVGMDMRGTAGSDPAIHCVDPLTLARFSADLESAADDMAVSALLSSAIAGCASMTGDLSHFGTADSARDIDVLREALGEEQLSIVGESYGTWTTTAYATLFPSRVRAAVLASAMPATHDLFERRIDQARGAEAALSGFFDWCDANAACAFRPTMGTTREAFDALVSNIRVAPLESPSGTGTLDRPALELWVSQFFKTPNYLDMATALAAAASGNPNPLLTQLASIEARVFSYAESLLVITSLDTTHAPGATFADWRTARAAAVADLPSYGPLFGERDQQVLFALAFDVEPAERFAAEAIPDAPPFYMVANDLDPATPEEGSLTLRSTLDNDTILLETHIAGHLSLQLPCALSRTQAYLLDPAAVAAGPAMDSCPAIVSDETVIGTVSAAFSWSRDDNRNGESVLGDLVADVVRASATTQIGIVNGGGIRNGIPASSVLPADTALRRPDAGYAAGPPYDVVVEDARAMFPFGNRIVSFMITGEELWDLLEHGLSTYDGSTGQGEFFQVSGISITFDPSAAAGARVQTLALEGGETIPNDASASYSIAIPDYVWYGGNGYEAFVAGGAEAPTAGDTIDDAFIEYFQDESLTPATDIDPPSLGRIVAL